MMGPFEPVSAVLVIPALAAAVLVVLPGYRLTAALNVLERDDFRLGSLSF
jgi:hypothetical protein